MIDMIKDTGADVLTPIEEYNGVLYKRDDLFTPFIDRPDGVTKSHLMCGGKVRQAIYLIQHNQELIKTHYNSTVGTASSVKSPQLVIISRVAKEFGFKFIGAIGGMKKFNVEIDGKKYKLYSDRIQECIDKGEKVWYNGELLSQTINDIDESAKTNPMVRMSRDMGGDLRMVSGMAYNNIIYSKLNEISKEEPLFSVSFGINLHNNRDAIVGSIAEQVRNIPKDLDNLIVPVGSAITFSGIMIGLMKYNIRPKRIHAIQIAGYDRTDVIDGAVPEDFMDGIRFKNEFDYEFHIDKTYPYAKKLDINIEGTDIQLSPVYESKAYLYAKKELGLMNGKTKDLYWIVGNEGTLND